MTIAQTVPSDLASFTTRKDDDDPLPLGQQLRQHHEFEHGWGATAAAVDAAENRLGVTFPASYRKFLIDFGWGTFGDFEICGLGADVPLWMDVVEVTRLERSNAIAPLPAHLLPIHAEGDEDQVCLDLRGSPGGLAPVVFWNHESGLNQTPTVLAGDFSIWLSGLL
jgi:cell wall assembly regulator SMI1